MRELCRTHPTVRKAHADDRELSVRAVLSDGARDKAGELVHLDGIGFDSHRADPWIDVEHGLDPEFRNLKAAWARPSLARPGGEYSVRRARLNFAEAGEPDDWRVVPVGKSYFDPADRLQSQAFALVKSDALPGVSLEFRPLVRKAAPVPWSELERRPAYDYPRVDVVRWTLCARPVSGSALTVTKAVTDPLAKVLADGTVHTGAGYEQLHPALYKALAPHRSRRTTVPVRVGKAMNDDDQDIYADPPADDGAPADVPELEADAPAEEGAPALGGIAALYAKAEALLDACDANEADMETSDSPELRKFAEKMRAKIAAIAEEIKGMADKHDAKLNGGGEPDAEPDTGEPADDAEPDMDRDDEGTLKAVRPVYRTVLKARRAKRFRSAEVEKAISAAESDDRAAAQAELDREARRFRRDRAIYG